MVCYWGFETTGNKIAWGMVAVFVILGAAFWFPGVIEMKKCMNKHTMCMCHATPSGGWVCADSTRDAGRNDSCFSEYVSCRRTPAAVWSIGWLFLVLLSWLPCCYFCCCSQNPKETAMYQQQQQGVQMGAVAVMPPTGHPYQYQYSGHQQPYQAAPLPGMPPPTPAYPAFAPTGSSGPAAMQQQQQLQLQQTFSNSSYAALPPQQSYRDNMPMHRY